MPDRICHGSRCKANTDQEVSVRITNPDGPQPKMRAFAEDVPMTQTIKDGDIVRWTGSNEYSITMILDLDTNDMTYTMTSKSLANPDSVFTGTCEVQ